MSRYTSDELHDICFGHADEALKQRFFNDPDCMIARGDNEETILHYAVSIGSVYGTGDTHTFLESLLNKPGVDLSLKDNNGNTAVHIAALSIEDDRVILETVFPMYVKKAEELGFDFSTQNARGLTVLHLATITSRTHFILGRKNGVNAVLENTKNPAIDTLSNSGSTALYYAINHSFIDDAHRLLDAGADPKKFGAPDRDPFLQIEQKLEEAQQLLTRPLDDPSRSRVEEFIQKVTSLKQKMLSIVEGHEVRKNARVLGQVARNSASVFARKGVPPEILSKIAGHTRTSESQPQTKSEIIASKHLSKPKTAQAGPEGEQQTPAKRR